MKIIITPEADKQYNNLTKTDQIKITKKCRILEENVFAGKKLSGSLSELRSLRAWPYRIIYYLNEKQKKIYIVAIAHRQGVYK